MTRRLLVIDNYDSFTYNLVQYLGGVVPVPPVHGRGVRWEGGPGGASDAWQAVAGGARRPGRLRWAAQSADGDPLPLAGGGVGEPSGSADGHGVDAGC